MRSCDFGSLEATENNIHSVSRCGQASTHLVDHFRHRGIRRKPDQDRSRIGWIWIRRDQNGST